MTPAYLHEEADINDSVVPPPCPYSLPDGTGFSSEPPLSSGQAVTVSPTCSVIPGPPFLVIALTSSGHDPARIETLPDLYTLINALNTMAHGLETRQ